MKKPVPYTHYKPSGVEWLGNVPSHWDVSRLKWCFDISCGSTPESGESSYWDGDVTWVTPADLSRLDSKFIYGSMRTITQEGFDSCALTLVKPGSVILATRAPIGTLGVAATLLCHNQGCKALSSTDRASSLFVYYYLLSVNKELNMKGKGTTFLELGTPDLGCFEMPVPPLSEQKAIAVFLDRETERIDGLIGKREKLIALLQEKRAALISHAVTKGLNPQAKMKPSGIDWLGDIPAHWEVKRLKYNFSLKTERFVTDENPIALENIESWTGRFIPTNSEFEGDGMAFKQGDILFGKLRPYLAKVFLAERNGEAIGDLFVMAPRQTVCPKFAAYLFRTRDFIEIIDGSTFGSKMPRASWGFVGNMPFPLSPLSEQNAIATYLDAETKKIDGLMEREQQIIERMKEYRSALISAAVTGKIDVRGSV